jgi:hypothetical protein
MPDAVKASRNGAQVPAPASDSLQTMQDFTSSWLVFAALGAAVSTAVCRWRYGRQRRRLELRLGKLQSDRDALQEHVKQARQQVAQLQKDLSTWRLASTTAGTAKAANAKPAAARLNVKVQPEIAAGLVFEAPQTAAHGFADTQPFESDDAGSRHT